MTDSSITVTLAGVAHTATPGAVLYFLQAPSAAPNSLTRATRLAAAEEILLDPRNRFTWERRPAEGFPGATRLHLYEGDVERGQTPIRYDWTEELERHDLAELALEAIDPRAAMTR